MLASHAVLGPRRGDRVSVDVIWSSLFASGFGFIEQRTDDMDASLPPPPLPHFRTLAVEEQFYMVWTALILLLTLVVRRAPPLAKLGVGQTTTIRASAR